MFLEIAHGEHGADALAGLQGDQVADVLALTSGSYIRDLVHLQPVNPAGVGEDQDVGVGRSNEQMLNEILVPRLHAGAAGSTAALHAVGGNRGALEVAGVANRHGNLFVGDQVFQLDLGSFVLDHGAAGVAVLLLDLPEFLHDHAAQLLFRGEDGFELGDVLAHLLQLVGDLVNREFGEAVQLEF